MTLLLVAVAGWLVANVLFVVWVTHLSRRGQERRRAARGGVRHGLSVSGGTSAAASAAAGTGDAAGTARP